MVKDQLGIALGGVRSPEVDVPTKTLNGEAPSNVSANALCSTFGSSTPFSPEKLLSLYPTHEDYVAKVTTSMNQLKAAGLLLEPEATGFVRNAEKAAVPR